MYDLSNQFIGQWTGTNQLFLSWQEPPEHQSETHLQVEPVINDQFLQFSYDWQHEGRSQRGVILVGADLKPKSLCGTWTDSWHQSQEIMTCAGSHQDDHSLTLEGSYDVEGGPEWHWRIAIQLLKSGELEMTMHNISPEGKEDLAVVARYQRQH